jgi:alpha-D-xyloside xylohydrolase
MRAMVLAFPQDRIAHGFEMQYMFGDALLFAPIIAAGGTTTVYFPAGENWFDLDTGERIVGGTTRVVQRALNEFALFGREGHVLCLGRAVQHTGEINVESPIEEAWLFGEPTVPPCVMKNVVRLEGARLIGVEAAQCRRFGDTRVKE